MIDMIDWLTRKKVCSFEYHAPDPRVLPGPKRFLSFQVSGLPCPVSLDLDLEVQSDPSIGLYVTGIDYWYEARNGGYLALNEIKSMWLHGGISLEHMDSDNTIGDVGISGAIVTASLGEIPVTVAGEVSGPFQQLSGEIDWRFEFPDFLAEFRQEFDSGIAKYSLNDEEISPAEFDAYFRTAGEPFFYISGLTRTRDREKLTSDSSD